MGGNLTNDFQVIVLIQTVEPRKNRTESVWNRLYPSQKLYQYQSVLTVALEEMTQ